MNEYQHGSRAEKRLLTCVDLLADRPACIRRPRHPLSDASERTLALLLLLAPRNLSIIPTRAAASRSARGRPSPGTRCSIVRSRPLRPREAPRGWSLVASSKETSYPVRFMRRIVFEVRPRPARGRRRSRASWLSWRHGRRSTVAECWLFRAAAPATSLTEAGGPPALEAATVATLAGEGAGSVRIGA